MVISAGILLHYLQSRMFEAPSGLLWFALPIIRSCSSSGTTHQSLLIASVMAVLLYGSNVHRTPADVFCACGCVPKICAWLDLRRSRSNAVAASQRAHRGAG